MIKKLLPKHKLAFATAAYWFLLLYIVVALVWWFVSLMHQNHQMTSFRMLELNANDPNYLGKVTLVLNEEERGKAKYIGEFVTFLALIGVGAIFVYRAVRKQFRVARQQQNFMMAVTHELKTPIAVAKLNLETLLKHKLDETKQQKLLQMTLQETDRLNTLANNILISSQLEGGAYSVAKEKLDLSALAKKSISEYAQRFPEMKWTINIKPELTVVGDSLLLQILINNLIDNAVKYSPKNGSIHFTAHNVQAQPEIIIADEGVGIADIEKQKIFQRFYRIGNEAVRKTKGTGLGLYLCKKIAADHNASISVKDNSPVGTIFTIHFNV